MAYFSRVYPFTAEKMSDTNISTLCNARTHKAKYVTYSTDIHNMDSYYYCYFFILINVQVSFMY